MRPVCLETLMWRSRNKLSVTKSTASYATSPSMMDQDPKRFTLTTRSGQRKRLKVLQCRLRSEVLSMAFYAWRGQPDHHCAIEAFNYGRTLRCYGIKIFLAFNASRQLRNMIKDAKNLLIDQRLQETSEHTASSHILYNW